MLHICTDMCGWNFTAIYLHLHPITWEIPQALSNVATPGSWAQS